MRRLVALLLLTVPSAALIYSASACRLERTGVRCAQPSSMSDPRSVIDESSSTQYCVYLINDDFNMREYVARVLMMVGYVSEAQAAEIMMSANWNGHALVGTWEKGIAQHTYDGLRKAGLNAAFRPAEDTER